MFGRTSAREVLLFVSRTLASRVDPGMRVVQHAERLCFCLRQVRMDGTLGRERGRLTRQRGGGGWSGPAHTRLSLLVFAP